MVLLHSRPLAPPEPFELPQTEQNEFYEKPPSPTRAASPTSKDKKTARTSAKKGSKKGSKKKAKESNESGGIVLLSSRSIGSPEPQTPTPALSKPQEKRARPTAQNQSNSAARRPAPPPPSSKSTQAPASSSKPSRGQKPKPQPEIVNRRSPEPSKLVEQEGVTLHPPVFKEVDTWANVPEDDPKFLKLPQWKQALIKRRRADIVKRTASPPPPSPPPDKTKEHIHTQWSPRNSLVEARAPELPRWKQDLLNKQQTGKVSKPQNYGLEQNNRPSQEKQQRGPASSNVRALLERFNKAGSDGREEYSPPPPPRPSQLRTSPPRSTPLAETEVQMASMEMSPGDSDSTSDTSDDDMDEIPLTNIDEISSDEDDSGISTKDGSQKGKKYSYSLVPDSPEEEVQPTITLRLPSEEGDEQKTSELIQERRPSILVDPSNRQPKVRQ